VHRPSIELEIDTDAPDIAVPDAELEARIGAPDVDLPDLSVDGFFDGMKARFPDIDLDGAISDLKLESPDLDLNGAVTGLRAKFPNLDMDAALGAMGIPLAGAAAVDLTGARQGQKVSLSEPVDPDNLRKIEGIGPKIASLLNDNGIFTFAQLAASSTERLEEIIENAGPRFQLAEPTTWPEQAALAAKGAWDELQVLQDRLDGGRSLHRRR
jgi:predicted flap endonuclease-1-like 5' DNA nuclease